MMLNVGSRHGDAKGQPPRVQGEIPEGHRGCLQVDLRGFDGMLGRFLFLYCLDLPLLLSSIPIIDLFV